MNRCLGKSCNAEYCHVCSPLDPFYLDKSFPELSKIVKATVLPTAAAGEL